MPSLKWSGVIREIEARGGTRDLPANRRFERLKRRKEWARSRETERTWRKEMGGKMPAHICFADQQHWGQTKGNRNLVKLSHDQKSRGGREIWAGETTNSQRPGKINAEKKLVQESQLQLQECQARRGERTRTVRKSG